MAILEALGVKAPNKREPQPGDRATFNRSNPEVAALVGQIGSEDARRADELHSAVNRQTSARDELAHQKSAKALALEDYAGAPIVNDLDDEGRPIPYDTRSRHVPRSFIKRLDADIDLAQRAVDAADTAVALASKRRGPWGRWAARVDDYIAQCAAVDAGPAEVIKSDLDLKRGETLEGYIERKNSEAEAQRANIRPLFGASIPADEVKAQIALRVSQMAAEGAIRVSVSTPPAPGERQRSPLVKVNWPFQPVALKDADYIPTVPDGVALYVYYHQDEVLADLNRQVDELYADGRLVLDVAERDTRIAAGKAELLAIERQLAEAIWQAREAGADLVWPEKVDVRAVLSIEGPEPKHQHY